jgi:hypothetical protein
MTSIISLIESKVDILDFSKADVIHLNWFKRYLNKEKNSITAINFGDF